MLENDEVLKTVHRSTRRTFFKIMGKLGLGAAASGVAMSSLSRLLKAQSTITQDTANQIITAALVAESLAITFYYNGLVGKVIQDLLAGPANRSQSKPSGNPDDISYIRAALSQGDQHASLLRAVGNPAHPQLPIPTGFISRPAPSAPCPLSLGSGNSRKRVYQRLPHRGSRIFRAGRTDQQFCTRWPLWWPVQFRAVAILRSGMRFHHGCRMRTSRAWQGHSRRSPGEQRLLRTD